MLAILPYGKIETKPSRIYTKSGKRMVSFKVKETLRMGAEQLHRLDCNGKNADIALKLEVGDAVTVTGHLYNNTRYLPDGGSFATPVIWALSIEPVAGELKSVVQSDSAEPVTSAKPVGNSKSKPKTKPKTAVVQETKSVVDKKAPTRSEPKTVKKDMAI